ncbi:HAD-superfamily hydrolase [Cylindrobasidium torrendii FP15055 ss-10]|uniref:HAD-superfamily hydrolase n=1 Tax=Cylindrobasidium torrendii FP15055 ss-10 TaxID=1314674 RepID=A0A0D7B8S9_9AGAR|nr:HAD-superfamily hydrolase [Cylindrobasidium torrendii FP15055 ss-10]
MASPIRLVTFDVFKTLIVPRLPIHEQYCEVFRQYLDGFDAGQTKAGKVKQSFKQALAEMRREAPAYPKGARPWWGDVILRTAVGAGAHPTEINENVEEIIDTLMRRFSSSEGYRAYEDAIPTIETLHSRGVLTAVVSNSDFRSRLALKDLGFPAYLDPILLSEEEGIEKPDPLIFKRALERINATGVMPPIEPAQCAHVGDEFVDDYRGALGAGWRAYLLHRPSEPAPTSSGPDGEELVDLRGVQVIRTLSTLVNV